MVNVEGANRMKGLGRLIFKGGLLLTVLSALAIFLPLMVATSGYGPPQLLLFSPMPTLAGLFLLFYLGLPAQAAGGGLWICGWILEGFLLPRKAE